MMSTYLVLYLANVVICVSLVGMESSRGTVRIKDVIFSAIFGCFMWPFAVAFALISELGYHLWTIESKMLKWQLAGNVKRDNARVKKLLQKKEAKQP